MNKRRVPKNIKSRPMIGPFTMVDVMGVLIPGFLLGMLSFKDVYVFGYILIGFLTLYLIKVVFPPKYFQFALARKKTFHWGGKL